MPQTFFRILVPVLLMAVASGCGKSQGLTAATIHGRDVVEKDLPELTKVIETTHARLSPWHEEIPRDTITIEVTDAKRGQTRYLYSPSRKAIFWLDDPKHPKLGCSVSGHSALTIERCFKEAE